MARLFARFTAFLPHVHLEEDQVLVGLHRGERSRFRADQSNQDQFGDVGHDLDLGFIEAGRARTDIDGKRGGQQPGGPLVQRAARRLPPSPCGTPMITTTDSCRWSECLA
jgi:hypothetical protein